MNVERERFFAWCLRQMNAPIPYVWGGKDPRLTPHRDWPVGGLDCSGFVTYPLALLGGPDWRATHNTDKLWAELEPTDEPLPGDLALYRGLHPVGPDDVEHVMVYVGTGGVPLRGMVVGQASGGREDKDPAKSRRMGRVTLMVSTLYREGFAGFRRMPLK